MWEKLTAAEAAIRAALTELAYMNRLDDDGKEQLAELLDCYSELVRTLWARWESRSR